MNNILLSLSLVAIVSFVNANDILKSPTLFFNTAIASIPSLENTVDDLRRNPPADPKALKYYQLDLQQARITQAIAQGNAEAIKIATPKQLAATGHIMVDGALFDMPGFYCKLHSDNALGLALFHAANNKTAQDVKKTIEMLKVLFSKKLNPYAGISFEFARYSRVTIEYTLHRIVDMPDWLDLDPAIKKLVKEYAAEFNAACEGKKKEPKVEKTITRVDIVVGLALASLIGACIVAGPTYNNAEPKGVWTTGKVAQCFAAGPVFVGLCGLFR